MESKNLKQATMSTTPNCSNHKKEVAGISDMKELADLIGDLHYETLADLLGFLTIKINDDGCKDFNSGRELLGEFLIECSAKLSEAHDCMNAVWLTCKPFMNNKTTQQQQNIFC